MKKYIIPTIMVLCLLLIIAISYYKPVFRFVLEEASANRQTYEFVLYKNRTLVVKKGYKKPIAKVLHDSASNINNAMKERDCKKNNVLIDVGFKILSSEDYNSLISLFNTTHKNYHDYYGTEGLPNNESRTAWRGSVAQNNKVIDIIFYWDELYRGSESMFMFSKSLIGHSPIMVTNTYNKPIYERTEVNEIKNEASKTYTWLERIMWRVWPMWYAHPSSFEEDDFLEFILWDIFPVSEKEVRYLF